MARPTRTGAVMGAPGMPFVLIARRACGCVTRLALVEHHDDRVRLERAWSRDGLTVRASPLTTAGLSVCPAHEGDGSA